MPVLTWAAGMTAGREIISDIGMWARLDEKRGGVKGWADLGPDPYFCARREAFQYLASCLTSPLLFVDIRPLMNGGDSCVL